MAKGGKRPGAGRKKGSKASHTIEAAKAREYLVKKIAEELGPILDKQIKLARRGSLAAGQYLMNQLVGKPKETMDVQLDATLKIDV